MLVDPSAKLPPALAYCRLLERSEPLLHQVHIDGDQLRVEVIHLQNDRRDCRAVQAFAGVVSTPPVDDPVATAPVNHVDRLNNTHPPGGGPESPAFRRAR
jgi:hypothetical protein